MTRELKFRAWDNLNKEMVLAFHPRFKVDGYVTEILQDNFLMQYTGLKDKNGKEIYEGDIVKVYDTNLISHCEDYEDNNYCKECEEEMYVCTQKIEYKNCGYFVNQEIGDYCPPLDEDYLELEIIGDIYSTPELLSASKE